MKNAPRRRRRGWREREDRSRWLRRMVGRSCESCDRRRRRWWIRRTGWHQIWSETLTGKSATREFEGGISGEKTEEKFARKRVERTADGEIGGEVVDRSGVEYSRVLLHRATFSVASAEDSNNDDDLDDDDRDDHVAAFVDVHVVVVVLINNGGVDGWQCWRSQRWRWKWKGKRRWRSFNISVTTITTFTSDCSNSGGTSTAIVFVVFVSSSHVFEESCHYCCRGTAGGREAGGCSANAKL